MGADPREAGAARQRVRAASWAAALVLLTTLTRLPALLYPHAIDDEVVHAVVGREVLDGGLPYVNAVENKPPLLFWTYATIFRLGGRSNWPMLHGAALLWTLLTMAGLYLLGRQLFSPATGLVAALLYSIFQGWAHWKNLAFSGELTMNLPIVWAVLLTLRRSRSRVRPELLLAGAAACAGFLFKQPAAIAAIPLGCYLLLPSYRAERGLRGRHALLHAGLFTLGFFGTLLVQAALLDAQGILPAAFYWIISHNGVPYFFWQKGLLHSLGFIGACAPLVLGAILSLKDRTLWAGKEAERVALVLWILASLVGTAAGARFYPHYYIQLIPPLAAAAAPLLGGIWSGSATSGIWLLRPRGLTVWLAVTVLAFLTSHSLGLAGQRAVSAAGSYVKAHSRQDDRLFVWGQAPRIYLDADRRPACRYIASDPLTGYIFGGPPGHLDTSERIVPGAWDHLMQDFAEHAPAFIVDTEAGPRARYPIGRFPQLARLLAEHYRLVYRAADGVIYQRMEGL